MHDWNWIASASSPEMHCRTVFKQQTLDEGREKEEEEREKRKGEERRKNATEKGKDGGKEGEKNAITGNYL